MNVHHFTVDVEEYFQVSALAPFVDRNDWDSIESRVAIGIDKLLGLLGDSNASATFFTLGWIAERHPELVKRIAADGHEIASHGWGHRKITDITQDEFRTSIRSSKETLEKITGTEITGYRAPSFSIVPGMEWTFDTLLEEGYTYDSSLFPVRRNGYGYPGGQRGPHILGRPAGDLQELPPTTLRRFGQNFPAAGGAYFRLFPYAFISKAFRDASKEGIKGTFYIHPWELDHEQPRLSVGRLTRIRHYGGLNKTVPRLKRLLSEFRFVSIAAREKLS